MTGSPAQVEWAERLRTGVNGEFDRVAQAFRSVATQQSGQERNETELLLGILEEKRAEVMANDSAGYFIRNWQELSDQVRQLIAKDPRFQEIQASRLAR